MARNLPWKTSSSSSIVKPARKARSPAPSRSKRRKTAALSDDESTSSSEASRSTVGKKKKNSLQPEKVVRQPSSSPEQESEPEGMIEGFEHDDMYMMVEDELIATAKKFTRQLHQDALEKMETEAKSKETVEALKRPVSITMPVQTQKKLQVAAGAKKRGTRVQKLLSKLPSSGEDVDDDFDAVPAWVGTSLHALMEAPKKSAPSLVPLGIIRPKEVAKVSKADPIRVSTSTSLSGPQQTTIQKSSPPTEAGEETASDDGDGDDDDDDLDAMPKRPRVHFSSQRPGPSSNSKPLPPSRQSIFARTQPVPGSQSSTNASQLSSVVSNSIPDTSTDNRPEFAASSTASKPANEGGSSLAEIRKKLREKRLREQEMRSLE